MELTINTLDTFLLFARDAGNWGGNPYISNGNIDCTKAMRGNLSDLVKKGLIRIVQDREFGGYVEFTAEGKTLASQHGITIYAN